jgi:hypothetical protein
MEKYAEAVLIILVFVSKSQPSTIYQALTSKLLASKPPKKNLQK